MRPGSPAGGGTAGEAVIRFRGVLADRMGWVFTDNDLPHLAAELTRRAGAHGLPPEQYLERLLIGRWDDELSTIAEHLTITETYFFRHSEQFRALSEVALPDRIAARGGERVLKLLSVGCSSGEEAYTLAIVAREAQPDPGWIISVLGLDANLAMLRKAEHACFSTWSLRETPDAMRERWFHPHDGEYEVNSVIRATARFRQHNVASDDPGHWRHEQYDVIFCRNLLMYLTEETSAALVDRMTRALVPGGYLFLGHTDSLGSRPDGLEAVHSHSSFYYRRYSVSPPAPRAEPKPAAKQKPKPPPKPPPPPKEDILELIRAERFTEALAASESRKAGRESGDKRDRLLHGVLLAHAGRFDEAESDVRLLLDTDGLCADAHHLLGVCMEGGAGVDAAIGHYRLAAYLDPTFAMPRLRLGLLYRRRGDHRAATNDLDRALHLLRTEQDDRIVLFGGGFGRIALTTLSRSELDACGVRR